MARSPQSRRARDSELRSGERGHPARCFWRPAKNFHKKTTLSNLNFPHNCDARCEGRGSSGVGCVEHMDAICLPSKPPRSRLRIEVRGARASCPLFLASRQKLPKKQPYPTSISRTMWRPMARDAVAAGLGALSTCRARCARTRRKSWMSSPWGEMA